MVSVSLSLCVCVLVLLHVFKPPYSSDSVFDGLPGLHFFVDALLLGSAITLASHLSSIHHTEMMRARLPFRLLSSTALRTLRVPNTATATTTARAIPAVRGMRHSAVLRASVANDSEDSEDSVDSVDLQREMDLTLDRLLPRAHQDKLPLPANQARQVAAQVLTQLRTAPELSAAERQKLQDETDASVKSTLASGGGEASSLRQLGSAMLQLSQDPRRGPIAFRIFEIAYAWGDDDAGYSWAGMVLANQAPPPPDGNMRARHAQAIETYKQLAERGNPSGKLGVGRLLLSQVIKGHLDKPTKAAVIQRLTQLWSEAGDAGLAEAWYELGTLYLGGKHVGEDEPRARDYFERGAQLHHPGSHYALGVLCSKQDAAHSKQAALDHFLAAAERGDVQSMYNVGVRYLLQPGAATAHPSFKSGDATLKDIHRAMWGVHPDDQLARQWFERASARSTYSTPPASDRLRLTQKPQPNPTRGAQTLLRP